MDDNKISTLSDSELSGNTIEAAYSEAADHFTAGRHAEAEKICAAIIRVVPDHVDAMNILGMAAQRDNRHDLAVEQFQRAINIDNSNVLLHSSL